MGSHRFSSFLVSEGESELWVGVDPDSASRVGLPALMQRAEGALAQARRSIQEHANRHPSFLTSLEPLPLDEDMGGMVREMAEAGAAAATGPMAAVAGAIAEMVGRAVLDEATGGDAGAHAEWGRTECVVENGGDLWLSLKAPLSVAVYSGLSSLSMRFGVELAPEATPCGLATSSGTVGPSLSFGKADAALVVASSGALADAWATALGNVVKRASDAERAVDQVVTGDGGVAGALVVVGETLAAKGSLKFVPLPAPLR